MEAKTLSIPLTAYWSLLRRYLVAQQWAALLMAGLLLASIGFRLVAPQVARVFIDGLQSGLPVGHLARLALLFIGAAVLAQAAGVLAGYWSDRVAWGATNALRGDLALHILRLDPAFFPRRTPGELIERVDGDVSALSGFFSGFTVQLGGSLCLLVGVLV